MRVLYFAWVRERMGVGSETVSPPESVATVAGLAAWLAARDERSAHALGELEGLRAAVDQELVDADASIVGAAEVAFFPPMTGG